MVCEMKKGGEVADDDTFIEGGLINGVATLPRLKVGGRWFWIDERLKQYRGVDEPFTAIDFRQMDDLCEIEDILKNPEQYGIDIKKPEVKVMNDKMKILFDRAIAGDMKVLEEMAELREE